MSTWLITHPACLEHDTGPGHPESIARLQTVLAALEAPEFQFLQRQEAPQATIDQIARVHDRSYVEELLASVPEDGHRMLDNDTVISPGSGEAALRAAGALCMAVDAVMAGEAERVFCAVRPPGHHAEAAKAMGFCLFNNVAVGALHARDRWKLRRIAVVDFDVHHGNGTQDIFWSDPSVLYSSTHQMPLYPGTGAKNETGAANTIVNAPLSSGDGGTQFREAFESVILPRINNFQPDLVLISAGFDAHRNDPLANLNLVEDDFAWVTGKLMDLADKHAKGRVVSLLEGGYDLEGLAKSAGAHVRALMRA